LGEENNIDNDAQQEQVQKGEQPSSSSPPCCEAARTTWSRDVPGLSAAWSPHGMQFNVNTNRPNIKANGRIVQKYILSC
jgi:hypothetical protein